MSKLTCVIVEDEMPAVEELKFILSRYDFIDIIGEAYDGETAYNLVIRKKPRVVFMDINIPAQNGMEIAKRIKDLYKDIDIVFVTAYEKYAAKAFEIFAADYILKPFDEKRIYKTVKHLKELRVHREDGKDEISDKIDTIISKLDRGVKHFKKIPCEYYGKTILIDLKEVYYCCIENDQTYVKTRDKKYFTYYALHEIEDRTEFVRVHRSFLVNIDNVRELFPWFHGTYKVVMNDAEKSEIPVSRSNVKRLKEIVGL